MPLTPSWEDIAVRLLLTVAAGALIGLNRSEGAHAAGLRTTLLVGLAAAVSMIQMNLLLPVAGKTSGSFATLDLMRLPLGILTGMGFIGGGVILRRGEMIHGVTTAATLWLVTVVGLCLGGGQLALGAAATAIALAVLWGMKRVEARLCRGRNARLVVVAEEGGLAEEDLRSLLAEAGFEVTSWEVATKRRPDGLRRTVRCGLRWRPGDDLHTPAVVRDLARRPFVEAVRWRT
ncbi:putative Mg(2+) transport ATPase [Aquisphaera giovannonii]|uniref:Putative Mg(2+) transport ATPase n=1 Tax=Aquisphaera giovannonii TaxID=406548 RepID=A0A5B9WDX9_9BACT|nr:MgtC/SapB family protein [Aquisphaera giovannonii]QEH38846.1 putative Mg(2+) transport ATPase [Aquisphaera giovannonii]